MPAQALAGYTYSFQDVVATLNGVGGRISLGQGSGSAAEGITVSMTDEKTTTITGADGTVQHSLRASQTGRITVRLLKTSPVNAQLNQLYHVQRGSAATWGQNQLTVGNVVSGDNLVGSAMAFVKHPDIVMATEGNTNDWEFSGIVIPTLGAGIAGVVGVV